MAKLPIIDVSRLMSDADDLTKKDIGTQIKSALEDHGFFRITGHGIDTVSVLNVSKEFYDLPIQEKQKLALTNWRGWSHLGSEITIGKKDWHECLDFLAEVDDKSSIFYGKNRYPTSVKGFEEIVETYIERCRKLGSLIIECIFIGHGLPADSEIARSFRDGFHIFRLLYYPTFPNNLSNDESIGMGIGPHTDYGCLTFVVSDREGLEVNTGGMWENVELIDDHIICNIGDMLALWSGTMKATEHRVRRIKDTRYSAAFFFEPELNAVIAPLNETQNEPIRYDTYLEGKYLSSYPTMKTNDEYR